MEDKKIKLFIQDNKNNGSVFKEGLLNIIKKIIEVNEEHKIVCIEIQYKN